MKPTKWIFSTLTLSMMAMGGCSSEASRGQGGGNFDASTDPIADVNHSGVKRQSIGNCWIYATVGWVESLNKSASLDGKTELNLSESYVTYWHWFDQLANGEVRDAITTGGFFSEATELMNRYGIMAEKDFIAEEADAEMSARQKSALDAVNLAIKSGELSTPEARRDRAKVRSVLDRAWGLNATVVGYLDRIFGKDVYRTLDRSARADGTPVLETRTLPVLVIDPTTKKPTKVMLKDAIGERDFEGFVSGKYAWQEASYPNDDKGRRAFLKRIQRALHDKQPVIMSWFVDFNAMETEGKFRAPPATVGRQGGHMVSLEDYQATVPGIGLLEAGKEVTDPKILEAALSDDTQIEFLRIKNSWGNVRLDRNFTTGYHDLYMKYLNGPVKECEEKADGTPDLTNCHNDVPFNDVVLPAGY